MEPFPPSSEPIFPRVLVISDNPPYVNSLGALYGFFEGCVAGGFMQFLDSNLLHSFRHFNGF